MFIQLLESLNQSFIIGGDAFNKGIIIPCLSSRDSDCLCLEVADQHFDFLIRALGILDCYCISLLKLRPLLICLLDDFNNLILREVYVLALIQTLDTICWLSLMVGTGLLLALIENLFSVALAHFGTSLLVPFGLLLHRRHIINSIHFNNYISQFIQ